MRLPNVLVCFSGQQGEITCRNNFSEDGLGPLLTCLVLVLNLQVFADKPGGCLHDFNDFVLENQELTRHQIDFEKHLIGDGVHVLRIDLDGSIEEAVRKWHRLPTSRCILLALEGRDRGEVIQFVLSKRVSIHTKGLVILSLLNEVFLLLFLYFFAFLRLVHAWQDQAVKLWLQLVRVSLLLSQQLLHKLIVRLLQLLVHASHDSNVVIIYQVHFVHVEYLGQLSCLVSEEKVTHGLGLERQFCS